MNAPDRLADLRVNPEWAKLPLFDRSEWQRVRFGDVVENLNETCDPTKAGIERYIGLEHLEPGSLHIQDWGTVSDGTTFTRRAHPGQVLFGKRRAYQRKLAIASFDAVVSGDIYVLAPKSDRLLGELLPYLCMSDRFFMHAVGTSAGSLSPRTNWSSLASFEFDLPPMNQQRGLSAVARALDECRRSHIAAQDLMLAVLLAETTRHFAAEARTRVPLVDVAEVNYGITLGRHREALPVEVPYLRVANVHRNAIDLSDVKRVRCSPSEAERFALRDGDVLLVEGHADVGEIGRASVWRNEAQGWLHQNHLIRARCHSKLIPEYLCLFVNSTAGQAYFQSCAKSTSGLNTINSTVVKELRVPVPDRPEQERVLARVRSFSEADRAALDVAASLRDCMSEIVNTGLM